jgi:uncharacterized protein YdaU (DUF1376 family)
MAADAPWTKIYHDDFLQGCRAANLSAEEVGVYATILLLMGSRGGPIEDDRRWIAGFAGTSTRKASQIIDRLAALPNKLTVRNGMIGNHKMMAVVEQRDRKSEQTRRAAHARWHGDEAELPLEQPQPSRARTEKRPAKPEVPIYPRDKPEDNLNITPPIKQPKPQKPAALGRADASPSVGARDSETQIDSTHPIPKTDSVEGTGGLGRDDEKPDRLADADLRQLYEAVATASGHSPSSPAQIDRAFKFVESWKADGIDFDLIVLPTIRASISENHEPTRTLGRFDARIRHEHARLAATSTNGRTYRAPPAPLLDPPDEDERFRPLRAALLDRLGPVVFSRYANAARFEHLGPQARGKIVMRVREGGKGVVLMDAERPPIIRALARSLGWDEVW